MYDSVATISVILPFVTAITIILIVFITKYLRDRSRDKVLMKALETGKEITPELFYDPKNENSKKPDPLTTALVSIGLGIGLCVALYFFFGGLKFAAFGLIPFFIGVGQLIAFFVNKNKNQPQL
jgi:hypothetical protein